MHDTVGEEGDHSGGCYPPYCNRPRSQAPPYSHLFLGCRTAYADRFVPLCISHIPYRAQIILMDREKESVLSGGGKQIWRIEECEMTPFLCDVQRSVFSFVDRCSKATGFALILMTFVININ